MIFGRVRNVSLNERIKLAWKKDEQQSSIKSTKKGPNFIENLCDSYAQCGIQSDIPLLLRKLFNALYCIPPNSVESERAFSITGQFTTKLISYIFLKKKSSSASTGSSQVKFKFSLTWNFKSSQV